jgi:hypothetical protein
VSFPDEEHDNDTDLDVMRAGKNMGNLETGVIASNNTKT